jgi:hypothetical protein
MIDMSACPALSPLVLPAHAKDAVLRFFAQWSPAGVPSFHCRGPSIPGPAWSRVAGEQGCFLLAPPPPPRVHLSLGSAPACGGCATCTQFKEFATVAAYQSMYEKAPA